jgi:hypothetical protein
VGFWFEVSGFLLFKVRDAFLFQSSFSAGTFLNAKSAEYAKKRNAKLCGALRYLCGLCG